MTRRKLSFLCVLIVFSLASTLAWNLTARAAYESAPYEVVESDGPFELRDYPELMLASTDMRTDSKGNDGSFMRLFRYISGENEADQKVAMTTPVFMEDALNESSGRMGFVIPKEVVQGGIPTPNAPTVQVRKRAGGRFAVMRFKGRMDAKSVAEAEKKLRVWACEQGIRLS